MTTPSEETRSSYLARGEYSRVLFSGQRALGPLAGPFEVDTSHPEEYVVEAKRIRIGDYIARIDSWPSTRITVAQDKSYIEDVVSLGILLRGTMRYSLANGVELAQRTGDGVLVPGWITFDVVPEDRARTLGLLVPRRVLVNLGIEVDDRLQLLATPSPFLSSLHGLIVGTILPAKTLSDVEQQRLANVLDSILIGLGQENLLFGGSETTARRRLLREVTARLGAKFMDPNLTIDSLAAEFGISPRSLQRLFEGTGTSVRTELTRLRAEYALRLLSDPVWRGYTVDQIRQRAGFASVSQLRRATLAIAGVTPRNSRQRPQQTTETDQRS